MAKNARHVVKAFSDGSPVCSKCDASAGAQEFATATVRPPLTSSSNSSGPASPTLIVDVSRSEPFFTWSAHGGTDTHRGVARAGAAWGEVYRADDLTLGTAGALKFLPEAMARNEDMLTRFRNEVPHRAASPLIRMSVRVYDVGEIDQSPFLSDEYVDGKTRFPAPRIGRSSLRTKHWRSRVDFALDGRGPMKKACCNRDLKPSN